MTIGIRITEEEEKKGIDAIFFGVNSYTSNGIINYDKLWKK